MVFKKNTCKWMFFAVMIMMAVTSSFGLKTSNGVYQIGSCTDLIDFSRLDGNASFNAELTASFDMSEKYTGKDSTCNSMFKGVASNYAATFNGNGFSISNLVFNDGGTRIQNIGLIPTLAAGALVENIVLENVYIKATGSLQTSGEPVSVGGIVGWMPAGTIQNCYVSGTIETTGENNGVGGIVGYMDGGTVQDCLSAVNISASNNNNYVGGIAGYATSYKGTATVQRCVYDGTSLVNSGNGNVGGLVGSSTGAAKTGYTQTEGTLSSCYYVTSVTTNGVGSNTSADGVTGVTDLNTPEVACVLNKGEWDAESETCSVTNGTWGNGLRLTNTGVSTNDDGEVVYVITFNANHGTFPDGAKTQKFLTLGTHITADEITNPTLTDSTLIGWSYDSTATTPDEDLGYVSKVDTLYAVWHTQEKVTFIANTINQDGAKFSNGTSYVKSVDYGATITAEDVESPKDFNTGSGESKVYYTFLGWSLNENATTPDTGLGIAEGPVTVYAVWKETASVFYTVTFDVNGHGSAPLAQRIESGYKATAPTDPSAEGFTFNGWYSNSYGTGAAFDFDNTAITSDITVYAKWSAITYNITYHNVENASNGSNPATYTALSDDITLQKPDSTGYTFGGWYYDETLTNPATTIASGSTGNKDFYAKWTETTYTITFAAGSNGKGTVAGNAGTDKSVKKYNEDLVLPMSGYTPRSDSTKTKQAGWNYTDGTSVCDIPFVENGDTYYTKNADATLYPCWTGLKSYTITYTLHFVDANGKSIADSVKTESFNETQTHAMLKPADLGLDLPGYTFGGWTSVTNANTKMAISFANDKFTMPSANVNIVGTSTLDTYTITYNNLGSKANSNATQYTVFDTIKLVAPGDSAKYAFVGWYDNALFTGDSVTSIAKGSTGDKTLYAKWRRTDYGSVRISVDGKTVYVEDDTTSIELTDEGIEVENIVFERGGLKPGIVATVVLPFDLPEGSSVNATFYTFNYIEANVSANKWVAHFKKQTTLPVADVPYVFILNSDADSLQFTVNGKAVVHAGTIQNKTSPNGDWTFIGTYEYHQWTKDDPDLDLVYGFSAYTDENIGQGKFGKAAVDCDILPARAYLKKRDTTVVLAKARSVSATTNVATVSSLPLEIDVSFDDENGEVMAIGKMNTVTGQVKINHWVDLKGRSSLKKPTAKGVYFNKKLF